jgi:hypothetical protein
LCFSEDALCLYDDPPLIEPDPNLLGLDSIDKSDDHIALYMPLRTLDELQVAKAVLGAGFTKEKISERFQLARAAMLCCLWNDAKLAQQVRKIQSKIQTIGSYARLLEIIDNRSILDNISHSVLHMDGYGWPTQRRLLLSRFQVPRSRREAEISREPNETRTR